MRYPGGKGKSYQHIINLMPPHQVYIETHLGGGAVLRHKRPALRNIGIDVDLQVIERWRRGESAGCVEIVHERAEDYLSRFPFSGTELVYADPPYHPDTRMRRRVYRHDYSGSDHEQLLLRLRSLPCLVILSGYDNDLYRDILPDWNRHQFTAKTHVGVRTETLWLNYRIPVDLHDSRYLGTNFREREVTAKRLARLRERILRLSLPERAAIRQWLGEVCTGADGGMQ